MSLREFLYWQHYLHLEPPDAADNARLEALNEAENHRTAALMAQITNMAGKKLADHKRVSEKDFLGAPPRAQTAEQQKAFLKALVGNPQ